MMVLKIGDHERTQPYYMEGLINGYKVRMIDSGSPFTIFALDEMKQIMEKKIARSMIENGK